MAAIWEAVKNAFRWIWEKLTGASVEQHQKSGDSCVNVQAGRDVQMKDLSLKGRDDAR